MNQNQVSAMTALANGEEWNIIESISSTYHIGVAIYRVLIGSEFSVDILTYTKVGESVSMAECTQTKKQYFGLTPCGAVYNCLIKEYAQ